MDTGIQKKWLLFLPVTCLLLLVFVASSSVAKQWPLQIPASNEWHIEYQHRGVDFFSLSRPKGEKVIFMFSRWPAAGSSGQIPYFVRQIADSLLEKKKERASDPDQFDDYTVEEIAGDYFSGQAAVFTRDSAMVHTIFMVSDGDGIWNGQFSGSRDRWLEAVDILGGLQRQ